MDGAHLRGAFVHTLLLATGTDAENQTVILAWAIVESVTESAWRWFLRLLGDSIGYIDTERTVIISDRDKGLESALDELPEAGRAVCVQHLSENVKTRYGIAARKLFMDATYALTRQEWDTRMRILKEFKVHTPSLSFKPEQRHGD